MKLFIPSITFGTPGTCTYCGYKANQSDHVIPISFYQVTHRSAYEKHGLRTYACDTCNHVLYDRVFPNFMSRMQFMQDYYNKRFIKDYKEPEQPKWTESELNELDHNLNTFVRAKIAGSKERKQRRKTRYNDSRLRWISSSGFARIMRGVKTLPQVDPRSDQFIPWVADFFALR